MNQENTSPVKETREQSDKDANYRRKIALLSAAGIIDFIPVSLYQTGVIRHLPDPAPEIFDSDSVNASEDAQVAGMPDGPVSLLMYSVNLFLAAGAIKKDKRNAADYLLAANTLGQAGGGAYYLYNMAAKQKKICPYCVTGALINFAALIPLYKLFKS